MPSLNDTSIDFVIKKDQRKELEKVIVDIYKTIFDIIIDVDLNRDFIKIENLREFIEKDNSILSLNPQIAAEWNYDRNGGLKPEYFASNSGKKVWWKCTKGHEWQAIIQSRNKGIGCPFCSGRNVIEGENDLQTVNPDLAAEWNYEKNIGLTPKDVLPNSEKKVWWKCVKGHEWKAMIGNRVKGQGCPYCSGKKVLIGFNDLETTNPDLAKEWHPTKNKNVSSCDVTKGSNKKVWWKCVKGHEWQANICDRDKGNGCPYCSGKKVLIGFNDLKTINPELAKEWDYERNGELTPEDVSANCNKSVWWKCNVCNYEWKTSISNRNLQHTGCPICSKKKTSKALSRRVIQLSLDNTVVSEFYGVSEASRLTGINRTSILRVCQGKGKTAGGFVWKYAECD